MTLYVYSLRWFFFPASISYFDVLLITTYNTFVHLFIFVLIRLFGTQGYSHLSNKRGAHAYQFWKNPPSSFINFLDFSTLHSSFIPSKPTRCQQPKAVGSASERSERGRSTLFKNPLFFLRDAILRQHKIFLRGVPDLSQIGHKKLPSLNWF